MATHNKLTRCDVATSKRRSGRTYVRETVQKLSGAGQVAPFSEPRTKRLAFHSMEAPSLISSSAENHAPKYALSQTVVDSPVEVIAGKDEADNNDFGQHDVSICLCPRL